MLSYGKYTNLYPVPSTHTTSIITSHIVRLQEYVI